MAAQSFLVEARLWLEFDSEEAEKADGEPWRITRLELLRGRKAPEGGGPGRPPPVP
jgi:hypothetical protein